MGGAGRTAGLWGGRTEGPGRLRCVVRDVEEMAMPLTDPLELPRALIHAKDGVLGDNYHLVTF